VLRGPGGGPLAGAPLAVTGGPAVRTLLTSGAHGEFHLALPYGRYEFSDGVSTHTSAGVRVFVTPFETTRVDLVLAAPGVLKSVRDAVPARPGLWSGDPRAHTYPEAFSLAGILLSREPASVTEPLNFSGLSDNRLALVSQRGYSWTSTQYKLQGTDATDSYQPGRVAILPDVPVMEAVVVRSAFAQTLSSAPGTEVGMFLAEPGASWHGTITAAGTGAPLSSNNLPPPAARGLVRQSEGFRWLTRDSVQAGGPLTSRADLIASVTGQWSSQAVPLAAVGTDQGSRLLFATARGRVRAGDRDQFEAHFSGSRADLSGWGMPAGIEALAGRLAPSFVLPGGFPDLAEEDHLDYLQAGWTHLSPRAGEVGALQVRYAYSAGHLDTRPAEPASAAPQSRVELLGGAVAGAPPLANLAVRTRHDLEAAWQPRGRRTGAVRHQLALGGGWKTSAPRNRFATPSGLNLITAAGTPAFVEVFNTPLDARARICSFAGWFGDHLRMAPSLSLDLGALADSSHGSPVPSGAGSISWTSVSPRVGFAWRAPHTRGMVLRGAYFRVYSPLAGRYLDFANPNSLSGMVYQWTDRNGDGWFQAGEQGPLLWRFGGPWSSISPSLRRPYADEFNVGAEWAPAARSLLRLQLFRRDEKNRIAAADTGVPAQAFDPRSILDPGPDGIAGTFDDQMLTVYAQNPATLGQDRYLLDNPPGLRMLYTGLLAEAGVQWRRLNLHASFVAEKSYGPTNPGDAVYENDPGVIGALLLDPNTSMHAAGRDFMDRAYVGKLQAVYAFPPSWGGMEIAAVADYLDGLVFARQLLVTGLPQGPFLAATTVRGSPEGGNRAQYALNWNLRLRREFRLPAGALSAAADILNVTNAAQRLQENDLSGPAFNLRLPVAIQPPRFVRLEVEYRF